MNSKSGSFLHIALAIASCLGMTMLSASADDLYFNNATGGNGTWEGDAGGTPWYDVNTNTTGVSWDNTAGDIAHFQGAGGTVDVAGDVSTNYMYFNAGDVTLNGPGTITVNTGNGVFEVDNGSNVTIDNNIQLNDSQPSDRFDIIDGNAGTVTLNGNISYIGTNVQPSGQALIFNGGAATNFVLNGSFAGSATVPGRLIISGGSITLNGDYSNANPGNLLEMDGVSTAYLGSSNLGTGGIGVSGLGSGSGGTVLTVGAQHITNSINVGNYAFGNPFTSGFVTIGGSTADISTYDHINTVVTGVDLTSVAGGRVIIGGINGNGDVLGLVKIGAGTVVLTQNSNETVTNGFNGLTAPYLSDIQQGTLLDNAVAAGNQSAFGTDAGNIQVEAGATLGGNGSMLPTQKVVVMAATGVIAVGESGQTIPGTGPHPTATVIAPKIGILTLAGGLATSGSNGLTLDFKLSGDNLDVFTGVPTAGTSNDLINLLTGNLTINGPVTVNLTALDPLATGVPYTLMEGNGDWTGSAPAFTFVLPTGYELDPSYGQINPLTGLPTTQGYIFDTSADTFSVQLELAPEPSTYGLMDLGLVLMLLGRRLVARTRIVSSVNL